MLKKVLFRTLCSLFVVTLACGALMAQNLKVAPRSAQVRYIGPPSAAAPNATAFIFNNLGGPPTNLYNALSGGYYVCGSTCADIAQDQWIGLQFYNKTASHAGQIFAAIGYFSGTKKVNLGIYTDNGGVLGTLLAGGSTTNIPPANTCCQLASVSFTPVALAANTYYWVAATADDVNASDFDSVWNPTNQANIGADVAQTGWFAFTGYVPGVAIKGTIP